jgi:hypothetical protein
MTSRLVKVLVTPVFITEDKDGVVTGDIIPKEPLVIFASDVGRFQVLLDEVQQRVTAHVAASKS